MPETMTNSILFATVFSIRIKSFILFGQENRYIIAS